MRIVIRTIGDMIDHHLGLTAHCPRCRHFASIDMHALAARLGRDHRCETGPIARPMVCKRCGHRPPTLYVGYVRSHVGRAFDYDAYGSTKMQEAEQRPQPGPPRLVEIFDADGLPFERVWEGGRIVMSRPRIPFQEMTKEQRRTYARILGLRR